MLDFFFFVSAVFNPTAYQKPINPISAAQSTQEYCESFKET